MLGNVLEVAVGLMAPQDIIPRHAKGLNRSRNPSTENDIRVFTLSARGDLVRAACRLDRGPRGLIAPASRVPGFPPSGPCREFTPRQGVAFAFMNRRAVIDSDSLRKRQRPLLGA